ncbi:Cytosolic copper metallochaperone, variant 2 [Lathyrus oleraceus]|uniref:Cytosolic copper metallochaperone, variant 2 n=1 Tax=Pisum sativum TaxID=3888 RepID=A0A9D5AWH4_PEA|nr:Cytosolic copper metallochaperone, variant 2 [Pisum sativum]
MEHHKSQPPPLTGEANMVGFNSQSSYGMQSMLKKGHKHLSGLDEAVLKNTDACNQLSIITRTSLGPNGMNEMVINHLDRLFVTNDAATIVNELEVQHPAAKILVLAYYKPPPNSSGWRGRKEPEVLAASSLKRLFVENQPYLVGGYCQHGLLNDLEPSGRGVCSKFFCSEQRLRTSVVDSADNILSVPEKYKYMKETCRKQLAFGKSRIHGFGIFAKHPYKGGGMVIEYTGELVRPSIADRRERFIYNSLSGCWNIFVSG